MRYSADELIDFLGMKFKNLSDYEIQAMRLRIEDDCGDMFEDYLDYVQTNIGAAKYATGCTKLVWFFDEYPDLVFKIPFTGYGTFNDDCLTGNDLINNIHTENFNLDNPDKDDELVYDMYKHANCDGRYRCDKNDYCDAEAFIYKEAKKNGIAEVFAATEFLCDFWGCPIYVSERVEDYHCCTHCSQQVRDSVKTIKSKYHYARLSDDSLEETVISYGLSFAQKLLEFLDKWDIDDLCSYNIGSADDKFKIFDYSSYREDY